MLYGDAFVLIQTRSHSRGSNFSLPLNGKLVDEFHVRVDSSGAYKKVERLLTNNFPTRPSPLAFNLRSHFHIVLPPLSLSLFLQRFPHKSIYQNITAPLEALSTPQLRRKEKKRQPESKHRPRHPQDKAKGPKRCRIEGGFCELCDTSTISRKGDTAAANEQTPLLNHIVRASQ